MVQGVDLWLNNPAPRRRSLRHQRHESRHQRRAESQHSGRLVRRGLRSSPAAGPSATANRIPTIRTRLHASAIYYLLENEIVPMFYERTRADPARVDAAREAVAELHQPAFRLPAHGARVYDASSTSPRTSRHLRASEGDFAIGARQSRMEQPRPRSFGTAYVSSRSAPVRRSPGRS